MTSFVLPLLAIAIALTPVVASARTLYQRELTEQRRNVNASEEHLSYRSEVQPPSEHVGTPV